MFMQEKRRDDEEADAKSNMQLAQQVAHAKIARDLSNEVQELFVLLLKNSFGTFNVASFVHP